MSASRPDPPPVLADGSPPATREELFRRLDALGIPHATASHPPVFTVEEAQRYRVGEGGAHLKNLFLRNKKGTMALLVCLEERPLDLKAVGRRLGLGRVSFGRPERLMTYLGVIPGAVTPFAVINDRTRAVRVCLDAALRGLDPVHCHPLDNAMTTTVATADLVRFLEAVGHPPEWVDLDGTEPIGTDR